MSMDRRFFLMSAGVAAAGGGAYLMTRPDSSFIDPFVGQLNAQEAPADGILVPDMVKGPEDAAVTVIEYASFTCPHCRSFHEDLWPQIEERFVSTGQVRFVYREVYFDRPGLWASMVARCGGEDKFFGIVDMIFSDQSNVFDGDGAAIAGNLKRLGLIAGIDEAELDACMTDGEWAQTLVGWYNQNKDADAVRSTPTFLINGVQLDGSWDRTLIPAIEAALADA